MDEKKQLFWTVEFTRKAKKQLEDLPEQQASFLDMLVLDLRASGPVQGNWPNYSKLGKDQHHCHLSPKWIACWEVTNKTVRILQFYYVGSRKDAPY